MNLKIPPPQLPIAASRAAFPASVARDPAAGQPNFQSLVSEFEAATSGPCDFLGGSGSDATARSFDAEGFFAKIEAIVTKNEAQSSFAGKALGDPSRADPFAGRPTANPANLEGPLALAVVSGRAAPSRLAPAGAHQVRAHPAKPTGLHRSIQPQNRNGEAGPGEAIVSDADRAMPAQTRSPKPSTAVRAVVEGSSIRIAGPLQFLSEAEEALLADEVAELMSAHGIGLTGLWLNGQQLNVRQQGSK